MIPFQSHNMMMPPQPQSELNQQVAAIDDNRSEYSVRTHSQFGQTSSYFSMHNGQHPGASVAHFG